MEKTYKVDLHVHTPASTCYESKTRTDDDYLFIVEKAIAEEIDVIAITDHNTISGYVRIMAIKEKYEATLGTLCSISESTPEMTRTIEEIKEKLSMFERILILPGVEITLTPGIHMLLICDVKEEFFISSVLDRVGYINDNRGSDDCSQINVSITDFLNMQEIRDKLVLAPHVDSDSGIYNELSGMYRARVFKSETLKGMSCNSPVTLAKIKSILTDPKYSRSTPIAFFNASDSHCRDSIGKEVTYLKLEEVTYDFVLDAFMNPDQSISDSPDPDMLDTFLKSSKEPSAVIINNDFSNFLNALCACLNTGYGNMIFGLDIKRSAFVGIEADTAFINSKFDEAKNYLVSNRKRFLIKMSCQRLGNSRYAYLITIRCVNPAIWCILPNELMFFLDHNGGVRKATVLEVENIIVERMMTKYGEVDKKVNDKIAETVLNLKTIMSPVTHENLAVKIESRLNRLFHYVEVSIVRKGKMANPDDYSGASGLGLIHGNLFYAKDEKLRLTNSYLRYTGICVGDIGNKEANDKMLFKCCGPAIIVTESGGSYMIDKDEFYLAGESDVLVLTPNREVSLYAVIAWLKSTVCLWSSLWVNDNANIYTPNVFRNLVIPNYRLLCYDGKLDVMSRKVVEFERQFVEMFATISEENQDTAICDFNIAVCEILVDIDNISGEICELSAEEMRLIHEYIVNKKYTSYLIDARKDKNENAGEVGIRTDN